MSQDSSLDFEGATCKLPLIGAAGDAMAVAAAAEAATMMMII